MQMLKAANSRESKSAINAIGFVLSAVFVFLGIPSISLAQNNQQVIVSGGVVNVAGPAAQAVMNISSTKNIRNIKGNNQMAVVNGAVVNSAMFGAYSELNIASRNGGSGAGNQVVSVGGPVVSQAAGMGVRNVVNIGGR